MVDLLARPSSTPSYSRWVAKFVAVQQRLEKSGVYPPGARPREVDWRLKEAAGSWAAAMFCLLAWHGDEVLADIERALGDRASNEDATRLLAGIGTRASQDVLLRNLDHFRVRDAVIANARRWPVDTLESLLAVGSRRGQRTADLFQLLAWRHPEWVEALRAVGDDPAVERLLTPEPGQDAEPGEWESLPNPPEGTTAPAWLNPYRLPRLVLPSGRVLPMVEVQRVVRCLISGETVALFTAESWAAFLADLLEQWLAQGGRGDGWVVTAQAAGADVNARVLMKAIRWFRGRLHRVAAYEAMACLVQLGTQGALMGLGELAQQERWNDLKERAEVALEGIAAERDISVAELEDVSVPDLGLGADGRMALDFGPRSFQVRVGHDLTARVSDASGRTLRSLPRVGAKDDPAKALVATAEFRELKKQLTAVLRIQGARMEAAMSSRRSWSGEQFRQVFLAHPVMRCVAHRLLWSIDAVHTFRVDEDFQPVDRAENPVQLPAGPCIQLAHPMEVELDQWAPVLADHEIITLVEQVGRGVYRELPDWSGEWVSVGALQGLVAHGWQRQIDGGLVVGLSRKVGTGHVRLGFECDDWYIAAPPPKEPACRTEAVIEGDRATMDPLTLSEALRDLARLPWRDR
ncbi:MAG: DUF4132 domain-containing protein [Propionibacteriaceae bacterium]|nr:DUF4132 domain-containing protein [Propionibacteriaceae bacterium]